MQPEDGYTQRKIEGGVGALREYDDNNFLKPNGRSRNLNIYGRCFICHKKRCNPFILFLRCFNQRASNQAYGNNCAA